MEREAQILASISDTKSDEPEDDSNKEMYRLGVEVCGVLMPAADAFDKTSIYNSENPEEYLIAPLSEVRPNMSPIYQLFYQLYVLLTIACAVRTPRLRIRS